jgi:hypothetical protein
VDGGIVTHKKLNQVSLILDIAGARRAFGRSLDRAPSIGHAFSLVVNEGLVGLLLDYFREHPAPVLR